MWRFVIFLFMTPMYSNGLYRTFVTELLLVKTAIYICVCVRICVYFCLSMYMFVDMSKHKVWSQDAKNHLSPAWPIIRL